MSILQFKDNVKAEIDSLYNSTDHQSVIFDVEGETYLAMKSNLSYFINPNEELYRNLLFKLKINSAVRKVKNSSFFVKNHTSQTLSTKLSGDSITVFIPTGEIIEIEEKSILFNNFTHLSSFFLNKSLSKQEAYSLLLSESFSEIFDKIVKNPSKHVSLINK